MYREHYPHGYRMDFVSREDVKNHVGLAQAYTNNQQWRQNAKEN
jgi:hypothetical protein